MMTLEQALLGKLAEECAEIAQRASKAQRFGLLECQPGQEKTNAERLMDEIHDLHVVMLMLSEASPITYIIHPSRIHDIEAKINKYLNYSRSLGLIKPKEPHDS